MKVLKSYEEQIIDEVLSNREYRQKRGEHFMAYDQRCFKALRAILQPLYDELAALRAAVALDEEGGE